MTKRLTKTGKYDYNAKRDRRRFSAEWIGETDDEGFMTNGKFYKITEHTKEGHYKFKNNFGNEDVAHERFFIKQEKK